MSKYIQRDKLGIHLLILATFWSLQAYAQLLVVNPTKLHADWEDGTWYSGVTPIPELNYQYPGEDITTDPDTNRFVEASTNFARSGDFSFRSFGQPPALRSEIAFIDTPFQFNIGDETYYSVSYCPDDTWLDTAIYDIILTQWKNFGSGPSAMLRLTNDGNHIPFFRAMDINYYFDPLPLNEWTDFVFFFKWSPGSDGITKIWRNGELVLHLNGQTSLLDGPGYMQMGMYTEIRQPRNIYIDNVRIGDSVFTNQLPAFVTDPISSPKAKAGWAYSGSISGSATDPEGSPPTYAKVAGPAWLQVAADGTLSGTPGPGDIGPNVFTVRAADNDFGENTATLNINVSSSHPITVATDDFESNSWSGGTGWSDDWAVTTGSTAPAIVLTSGNYSVRLRDGANNHSITRTLGSPISDGTLKFKWDVDHLDSPSEYAYAEVFDGSWHTVWSMNSGGNGGDGVPTPDNLQEASVDLSAYGAVTQLRFSMSSNTSGSDYFFIDDIELRIYVDAYYEAWRNSFSLSDEDAALLGDPDLDGLDNLGEYGLGGYPDQAGLPAGILPVIQVDSGGSGAVNMIYRRRRDAAARGLSYYLDLTGNLDGGPWSTGGYTETGTQVLDADFESVTNEVPVGVSNEFIRLNIQLD